MSAHTPGPWSPTRSGIAFSGSAGFDFEPWGNTAPISEADARLIAAAPDLLAALQDLIDVDSEEHAHSVSDDETHRAEGCAFCAAVAAIAKAEGRDA